MLPSDTRPTDLLHPRPKRRLIGISVLPAAATLGNLLCGFLALYFCLLSVRAEFGAYPTQPRVPNTFAEALPTHIAVGVYLILLAMVFDALDGRLARMTRRTSEFGAQLDSLSDVVSFGVAPAALFLAVLLRPHEHSPPVPVLHTTLQFKISFICALTYVSCAAIRLARYNAENVKTEAAQKKFSGLPSPGAAAAMAALLALHEKLHLEGFAAFGLGWKGAEALGVNWAGVLRWAMAVAAVVLGLLMVSRLNYVHVFNVYFRRKRPPTHLIFLIILFGIGWHSFELLLVVLAFAYVLSGPLMSFAGRGSPPAEAEPAKEEGPRLAGSEARRGV